MGEDAGPGRGDRRRGPRVQDAVRQERADRGRPGKALTLADYVEKRPIGTQPLFGGRRPLLSHLDAELTERCDSGCIHCCINRPRNDPDAKSRELRTDEWTGILAQAAELGALSVRFTGGEPLLRDDFSDIYLCARRLGMRVTIFTNARRVTAELADLFARVPPLDGIEVSVYGMRQATYEAVTGAPGSFAEFRRGVELLRERGVPFLVKGIVIPPTRDEIDEFEAWAATLPGMERPPSYALLLELRGRRDATVKNWVIESLRATPEEGVALLARRGDEYRARMRQFCPSFMGGGGDRLFACGAGRGSACVDAYGLVQPCIPVRDPALSCDLRKVSLRDVVTTAFPRLREMKAHDPGYLARCARCFLKGLCEQCPGKSWSEHGTLDTPVEYLCRAAHAQARFLGLLSGTENAWEVRDGKERVDRMTREVAAT